MSNKQIMLNEYKKYLDNKTKEYSNKKYVSSKDSSYLKVLGLCFAFYSDKYSDLGFTPSYVDGMLYYYSLNKEIPAKIKQFGERLLNAGECVLCNLKHSSVRHLNFSKMIQVIGSQMLV